MPQTSLGRGNDDKPTIGELRNSFEEKTEEILPSKAKTDWPIHLDHCFKRVVLDDVVKKKWDKEIRRPAIKNMSYMELRKANHTADKMIKKGKPMVEKLNDQSLKYRGELDGC